MMRGVMRHTAAKQRSERINHGLGAKRIMLMPPRYNATPSRSKQSGAARSNKKGPEQGRRDVDAAVSGISSAGERRFHAGQEVSEKDQTDDSGPEPPCSTLLAHVCPETETACDSRKAAGRSRRSTSLQGYREHIYLRSSRSAFAITTRVAPVSAAIASQRLVWPISAKARKTALIASAKTMLN